MAVAVVEAAAAVAGGCCRCCASAADKVLALQAWHWLSASATRCPHSSELSHSLSTRTCQAVRHYSVNIKREGRLFPHSFEPGHLLSTRTCGATVESKNKQEAVD